MSGIRRSISELTDYVNGLANETNQHLNEMAREIANLKDVISVVIQAVGEDAIKSKMNEMLANRLKAEEEAQTEAIKLLAERGSISPTDVAEGDVLVVGKEDFKDGRVRQARFELKNLAPEGAVLFTGKKVGDAVEAEASTMTITGVYKINREAVKEQIKAEQEAATATVQ